MHLLLEFLGSSSVLIIRIELLNVSGIIKQLRNSNCNFYLVENQPLQVIDPLTNILVETSFKIEKNRYNVNGIVLSTIKCFTIMVRVIQHCRRGDYVLPCAITLIKPDGDHSSCR